MSEIAAKKVLDEFLGQLTEEECQAFLYDWSHWARPNQIAPDGSWVIWLLLAGRGFGKTRAGAEFVRRKVTSGQARRVALIAPTASDARDVIVEGESGILATSDPRFYPIYEPSKRRLTWPNGAIATTYSADEPDRLRGPQHDLAWADEVAAWRYLQKAWSNLMFGLRIGQNPQVAITTTPRPMKFLRELVKNPRVQVSKGTSYDNRENLAESFYTEIISAYEGTRLGRQELGGEILQDVEGALWAEQDIEASRIFEIPEGVEIVKSVVAIDPSGSSSKANDEVGMVYGFRGSDGHAYIKADASGHYKPSEWGTKAVLLYDEHSADLIVGERNYGGDMVESTVTSQAKILKLERKRPHQHVSYKHVVATRGKVVRAQPVAALYEKHQVHHVGRFPALEQQMCEFTMDFDKEAMGYSPDRVDALVWLIHELMLGQTGYIGTLDLTQGG